MTTPLLPGNRIQLLECGREYFPALLAAMRQAQHEICLETYIYENDATGTQVTAALCAAAQRGVRVRLVVDGFGSREFLRHTRPGLTEAGVEVLIFRRELGRFALRRHRLRRLHRKLAVIDQQMAFVGGINIIDDAHTPRQTPPRMDYAVCIEGPLVAPVWDTMAELWDIMCWANFKRRPLRAPRQLQPPAPQGEVRAALVLRDNLRHRTDIEIAYLSAFKAARHEITLANAYFLPGRRFRNALIDAAKRGVRVTLVLQGRVEYWLFHHACRALYPHLLAAGVHIVEYRKSFLHAKVAVIDADWATVGSSNIDPFSLLLAREANVLIRDAAFSAELRTSLQAVIEDGGELLDAEAWRRRPRLQRLLSWAAYGMVRLLIGLAGYGRFQ